MQCVSPTVHTDRLSLVASTCAQRVSCRWFSDGPGGDLQVLVEAASGEHGSRDADMRFHILVKKSQRLLNGLPWNLPNATHGTQRMKHFDPANRVMKMYFYLNSPVLFPSRRKPTAGC